MNMRRKAMMDSFKEGKGPDPERDYGKQILTNVKLSFEAAKQREEDERLRIKEEESSDSDN